jgi:phosphoribosylformylglycinamidine (FGAM) synthase-like enzyme
MVKSRDISVVGGSGDFFMHWGIATIMTSDAFKVVCISGSVSMSNSMNAGRTEDIILSLRVGGWTILVYLICILH